MRKAIIVIVLWSFGLFAMPQTDFIVNDDTLFGRPQENPFIAKSNSGFTVVVFEDDRNWYDAGRDIYGTIYDSTGDTVISNWRINEDSPQRDQYSPAVAITPGGKFLVVFVDESSGDPDISAKLFAPDGTPLTSTFRVNDDVGGVPQEEPTVVCIGDKFIVFFVDERNGERDIYWEYVDTLGNLIMGNRRLPLPDGFNEYEPYAKILSNGNIVLAFRADYDFSSKGYDVYIVYLSSTVCLLRGPVRVNDDNTARKQSKPAVEEIDSTRIMIVFEDERNVDADIYGAIMDTLLNSLVSNFRVNDDITTNNQIDPWLSRSSDRVLVVFGDYRGGTKEIYGQFFDLYGNQVGSNFMVNDPESGERGEPSVAFGDTTFTVVFTDTRNGEPDIYAKKVSDSGNFVGNDYIVVFEPTEGSVYWQTTPDVAVTPYGNFQIVFYDDRNMSATLAPSIYLQCYTPLGEPVGPNRRVEDDSTGAWRRNPRVASGEMGKFFVVFEDERDGISTIYGQLFDLGGNPIGDNMRIGELTGYSQTNPAVAHTAQGYYLVVWQDARGGDADIYGQYVDEDGNLIGTNFPIVTGTPSNYQLNPAVAMDSTGRAFVVFADDRDSPVYGVDIYGVYLDPAGAPLSPPFKINDDTEYANQSNPSVAMNSWGAAVVVFTDYRNSALTASDIYGQFFDPTGTPIGSNFKVNDDTAYVKQDNPDAAIDEDGAFIVVFEDERGESPPDIYAQLYGYGGIPADTNFRVSEDTEREIMQMMPEVSIGGGNLVITWYAFPPPDAQNYNPDVFAELSSWSPPTVIAERKLRALIRFEVYPNPMMKNGVIHFSLSGRKRVQLTFYDVTGRKVLRKDLGYLGPGVFNLPLDIGFFRSGVYFLEIRSNGELARRTFTIIK